MTTRVGRPRIGWSSLRHEEFSGADSTLALSLAGLVVLSVGWPVFVFTGSQLAYVLATLGACMTAAGLARARASAMVGFLLVLTALVGTDVNGQLGVGRPLLGSLRLLDVAVGVAAMVLGTSELLRRRPRVPHLGGLAVLAVVGVSYAVVRWATEGHRVDSFLRTDLRLVAIAALVWFVVHRCQSGTAMTALWSIVVIGALAAAKALAIYASGVTAVGSFDRLQANSQYALGHFRTILVGGDTLLILLPGLAVVLLRETRKPRARAVLAVAILFCVAGESVSGTRTSLLVSVGLVLLSLAALGAERRPRLTQRTVIFGVGLALIVAGLMLLGGAPQRIVSGDAPSAGLAFRQHEIDSFLRMPATGVLLGQGLGGRFVGTAPSGLPVLTAWAHELPVWLALKDGLLGLACGVLAIVLVIRRVMTHARRAAPSRTSALAGAIMVTGLVVMSLTLGRIALVEGVVMLVIAVSLIGSGPADPDPEPARPPDGGMG